MRQVILIYLLAVLTLSAHAAYITVQTEYGPVTGIHDAYSRAFRV